MMKKIYYILPVILLLMSCYKTDGGKETRNIRLQASIDASMSVSTKTVETVVANPYYGTSSSGLKTSVWFSTVKGVYEDNPSPAAPTYIPYHADVEYAPDGMATVYKDPENKQYPLTYPIDNDTVYCVGVYPRDGWTLSGDSKTASRVINGKDDIMYAAHKSGTWQHPIQEQVYKHQLTMLKVIVRATSFDATESWGKIRKITIMNPYDAVEIDLKSDKVSYTGSAAQMILMDTPMDLDVTPVEIGSVMCAPDVKYNVIVESEKSYVRDVNVILKTSAGQALSSADDAKGKYFIINLYFNSFNDIDANGELLKWNEEYEDLNG